MKYFLCILVFACLTGTSCRSSSPKKLITLDSMKVIMWDMVKIDELYLRMTIKDSTLKKTKENIRMYEEVLALHHVSKGLFDSTFKFYEAHPEEFKILVDSMEAYSNREKEKVSGPHGQAK